MRTNARRVIPIGELTGGQWTPSAMGQGMYQAILQRREGHRSASQADLHAPCVQRQVANRDDRFGMPGISSDKGSYALVLDGQEVAIDAQSESVVRH